MDLYNVPTEYLDLKEVFSKSRAASLLPHRPYDCAIDLLPGTSPPKGRLYSLSAPEREAMEKYISDSVAAKLIRPSSPAGAGLFFIEKKDGSLRPCIDYRGLNSITVSILILCRWCLRPSSGCRGLPFSRSWTFAMPIIWSASGRGWVEDRFSTPPGAFWISGYAVWAIQRPAVFQALVNDVLRDMVDQFIYVYLDDILTFSYFTQASASEAAREWAFCQGGEMRFSCTVCPLFRIHHFVWGSAHGSRKDSSCGRLANPRFLQGPAEVSGLCQFLPTFYLQLQPASRPSDCLDLHQDDVQVVWSSRCCTFQPQEPLCFSSHSYCPWSLPSVCGGGRRIRGGGGRGSLPAFFFRREDPSLRIFFSSFVPSWAKLWHW